MFIVYVSLLFVVAICMCMSIFVGGGGFVGEKTLDLLFAGERRLAFLRGGGVQF